MELVNLTSLESGVASATSAAGAASSEQEGRGTSKEKAAVGVEGVNGDTSTQTVPMAAESSAAAAHDASSSSGPTSVTKAYDQVLSVFREKYNNDVRLCGCGT